MAADKVFLTEQRAAGAARMMLEVDGAPVGFVTRFSGGDAHADTVSTTAGPDQPRVKSLTDVKYTPLAFEVGFGFDHSFLARLVTLMAGNAAVSGRVYAFDPHGEVMLAREFVDAQLSGLALPDCASASKESGALRVELTPELIHDSSAKGKGGQAGGLRAVRPWSRANFKLHVDGLVCTKVSSVAGLKFSRLVGSQQQQGSKDHRLTTGTPAYSDLALRLPVHGRRPSPAGTATWSSTAAARPRRRRARSNTWRPISGPCLRPWPSRAWASAGLRSWRTSGRRSSTRRACTASRSRSRSPRGSSRRAPWPSRPPRVQHP